MINFNNFLPRTAIMYSMQLAHLNSAFNPILYGVFNPAYQNGYKRFIYAILNKPIVNENQSTKVFMITKSK